ncbi:MAG: LPS-assembly protein LptD [Nevskiales bacterium]
MLLPLPIRVAAFCFLSLIGAAAAAEAPQKELLPNRVGVCPLPPGRQLEMPQDPDAPAKITADSAELGEDGSTELHGKVRLEQEGKAIEAENLSYNRQTGEAKVSGGVRFGGPDLYIESESAEVDLSSERGEFRDSRFHLRGTGTRGSAAILKSTESGVVNLESADYTTCDEERGKPFWKFRAREIELDKNTGWGEAWGAQLRIKDVPVFYLPYIWFPIDDRRKSGLLPPLLGTSSRTGFDLAQPYYINIAPNYDATITPRFMSDRGLQLASEFRYLWRFAEGEIGGEYLSNDQETDENRYLFLYKHRGYITRDSALYMDYRRVSDNDYFADLKTTLSTSAATHLQQNALVAWQPANWFSSTVLVSDFQTISRTLVRFDRPYARYPQLRLNFNTPNTRGFRLELDGEATVFAHDDPARIEGSRFDLRPAGSYIFDNGANFARAEAAFRYTAYRLDETVNVVVPDERIERSLPQFSLDLGQRYQRPLRSGWIQTLEPRLFYLYTEFEDQTDIPIFDAGEPDFVFDQLFVTNRFTGVDRIGDANQITAAATTRFIDPRDGLVRFSASLGQIRRLDEPRVTLPAGRPLNEDHSDIVGALEYRYTRNWSSGLAWQYDPEEGETNRASARLRYADDTGRLLGVAYRFRRDLLKQADFSFAWPVSSAWSAIGRYTYSLEDDIDFETLLGAEYRSCCWAITAAARRYIQDASLEHTNGFYVQLELTGLGRLGDNFARLLENDTLRNAYY